MEDQAEGLLEYISLAYPTKLEIRSYLESLLELLLGLGPRRRAVEQIGSGAS